VLCGLGEQPTHPTFWLARQQKNPQRTLRASSEECEGPRQTGLSKPATGSEWRAICFTPPPRACVCVPPRSAARERETRRERGCHRHRMCGAGLGCPAPGVPQRMFGIGTHVADVALRATGQAESKREPTEKLMCSRSKRGARCNPVPCVLSSVQPRERERGETQTQKNPHAHRGESDARPPCLALSKPIHPVQTRRSSEVSVRGQRFSASFETQVCLSSSNSRVQGRGTAFVGPPSLSVYPMH